jgi:monoamine oxidase
MKTLIIGGGLSGLALADALEARGEDYILLEARDRFGGRIMTERHGAGYFDMGPAWFWPGQPRIAALIDRLGLERFDQFADGILTFENERGQVQRGRGFASMQGSWRLKGGLGALTAALADRLPKTRKRLNAQVTKLTKYDDAVTATLSNGDTLQADRVVMALPPRVAATIEYTPALPQHAVQSMNGIATWMAGQAKAIAVYDSPFWRDEGLSGDAQSQFGPLVEIHDASPATGGPYALFGFIGVPPQGRADEQVLRQRLQDQLVRLFGPKACEPVKLYVKDWAFDSHTSTEADQAPLYAHPTYGLPHALSGLWDDTIHFAGTEVAPQFGGYIEGALEAAENVLSVFESKG